MSIIWLRHVSWIMLHLPKNITLQFSNPQEDGIQVIWSNDKMQHIRIHILRICTIIRVTRVLLKFIHLYYL